MPSLSEEQRFSPTLYWMSLSTEHACKNPWIVSEIGGKCSLCRTFVFFSFVRAPKYVL